MAASIMTLNAASVEIGRGRRRLHDRRHAGEQGRRQLLEHSPDGEVEGVDVHRRALQRGVDVLADEGAGLRQAFERAVEEHMGVGKFAAALGREGEEGAGAALDVDPAVLARRAGQVIELVQLLLARHDRLAERLQHPRPLVEVSLRSAGPPTSRAWRSIAPKSRPAEPVVRQARRRWRSGFRPALSPASQRSRS